MRDGRPQMFANEVLMIIYQGVYGSLDLNSGYRSRYQGTLYLSNARLIFINSDVRHAQSNFALHLNLIERETYYIGYPRVSIIQGYATPYLNYLPSPGNFKFEMLQDPNPIMNGIKNLLNQIRSIQKTNNLNEARSQAFVDPNDPDILYMIDSSKG
jgi:hypothetical protein